MNSNKFQLLYTRIKKYLRELQRADDKRKKRWFVATSIVTVMMVLALWVLYLNLSLPRFASDEPAATSTAPNSENESFFKTFSRGLDITLEKFKEDWTAIEKQLNNYLNDLKGVMPENKQFSIEGSGLNFSENNPEPVPPTPLP